MAVLLLFVDPILYGIGARTADSAAATAAVVAAVAVAAVIKPLAKNVRIFLRPVIL